MFQYCDMCVSILLSSFWKTNFYKLVSIITTLFENICLFLYKKWIFYPVCSGISLRVSSVITPPLLLARGASNEYKLIAKPLSIKCLGPDWMYRQGDWIVEIPPFKYIHSHYGKLKTTYCFKKDITFVFKSCFLRHYRSTNPF